MARSTTPGIAADLREQVELKEGPEDNTVVVFEYCYDLSLKPKKRLYYTFAAIYIEATGNWYSSGQGGGVPREAKHEAFMTLIASSSVKAAWVADTFTKFKP